MRHSAISQRHPGALWRLQVSALSSRKEKMPIKKGLEPWWMWLRWLGVILCTMGRWFSFWLRVWTWVAGSIPQRGSVEANNPCFSLIDISLSSSPLSNISIKTYSLKKKLERTPEYSPFTSACCKNSISNSSCVLILRTVLLIPPAF